MAVLTIVPNAHFTYLRQDAVGQGEKNLPVTLESLAAQILKEGRVSYKEDKIAEEIAVWQAVHTAGTKLHFFKPIAHYPGFIQELKWLFRQIDFGEAVCEHLPPKGAEELGQLHGAYHTFLQQQAVLDQGGQYKRALQLVSETNFLPQISKFELKGIGELSPLETEFLKGLAHGRPIIETFAHLETAKMEVRQAADPYQEVEQIGLSIRQALAEGIPLREIKLAFPNPNQYLPILLAVFHKLGLPWREPPLSLANTPLGKIIVILLQGELEGWHKHHLELLTAPGWGFPLRLTKEEQRLLRYAPPHKGIIEWQNRLGREQGWQNILDFITRFAERLKAQPLGYFGLWLKDLLLEMEPGSWQTEGDNGENLAQIIKAWDALQTIADSLQHYDWHCTPQEFLQIFQAVSANYLIRPKRIFQEQLQVLSLEQLGAATYQQVYIGGLVEGQFPGTANIHWLTKVKRVVQAEQLYNRLVSAGQKVFLYYPEVDLEGKLNLPSTFLPRLEKDKILEVAPLHKPSIFLEDGSFRDEKALHLVGKRILEEGLTVSQLNSYANCPYRFFCSYVLEIEYLEEEVLGLDAREEGIIIHQAFLDFWRQHLTGPIPELEFAQGQIEGLVRKYYAELGEIPSPSLIRSLRWFMRQDLARVGNGFRPKYLEEKFTALSIDTSFGPVKIRGQIDRIDVSDTGAYVLYDYKTGSAPAIRDILQGKDLQIGIYLLAAESLLPDFVNIGAAYYLLKTARLAGVFNNAYNRQLLVRNNSGCLGEKEFTALIAFFKTSVREYLEAIFAGEFPIRPANAWNCRFCPFQGICRKEGVTA